MFRLCVAMITAAIITAIAPANARDCDAEQFGRLVDETGAKLRTANARSETAMRRSFGKLAKIKGWPESSAVERGFQFLQDEQTQTLDQQASELLIRLDLLSDTESKPANCQRLDELKLTVTQLLEVTTAKRAHINAKLSVALNPKLKRAAKPSTKQSSSQTRTAKAPPPSVRPPAWSTKTTAAPLPSPEIMAALPPVAPTPQETTFSSGEIRAAGRGLFGTITAELATVIRFAFESYGKPNGYVLGAEGGAAFFAGLRYGKGKLVSKQFDSKNIYWQGPSIGTDFGITGSRVLMLVYNLDDPRQIYKRFVGVEGAAYLVGGVGITFHQQGRLVLAPIRTGLGLRIGANVGYLKITPRRQYNPF